MIISAHITFHNILASALSTSALIMQCQLTCVNRLTLLLWKQGEAGSLSVAHQLDVAASSQVSRCDNKKGAWWQLDPLFCFGACGAPTEAPFASGANSTGRRRPLSASDRSQRGAAEGGKTRVVRGLQGGVNKQRDEYMLSAHKKLTVLSENKSSVDEQWTFRTSSQLIK